MSVVKCDVNVFMRCQCLCVISMVCCSSLQSLVSCDISVDVCLGRHLVEMCEATQDSMNSRRKLIDNMASLTENFPLGNPFVILILAVMI